jgi:hypothetical protein
VAKTGAKGSTLGGVGGAGGGTALVAIAEHLAILFGGLIGYMGLLGNWTRQTAVGWRAEKTLEKALNDPNISDEKKAELRAKREEYMTGLIERRIEQANQVEKQVGK